jgi:hypothetical protein
MNADVSVAPTADRLVVDASVKVDDALVSSVKSPLVNESDVPPRVVAVALVSCELVAKKLVEVLFVVDALIAAKRVVVALVSDAFITLPFCVKVLSNVAP